jgi:hypothetical protein
MRMETGSFPRDDTYLQLLSMSDRRALRPLVVPERPLFTSVESEHEDSEITDLWNDTGGTCWQDSRAPLIPRRTEGASHADRPAVGEGDHT